MSHEVEEAPEPRNAARGAASNAADHRRCAAAGARKATACTANTIRCACALHAKSKVYALSKQASICKLMAAQHMLSVVGLRV